MNATSGRVSAPPPHPDDNRRGNQSDANDEKPTIPGPQREVEAPRRPADDLIHCTEGGDESAASEHEGRKRDSWERGVCLRWPDPEHKGA